MTKFQATITFDYEIDLDEIDPEVFVTDALPDLVSFDYDLVVTEVSA